MSSNLWVSMFVGFWWRRRYMGCWWCCLCCCWRMRCCCLIVFSFYASIIITNNWIIGIRYRCATHWNNAFRSCLIFCKLLRTNDRLVYTIIYNIKMKQSGICLRVLFVCLFVCLFFVVVCFCFLFVVVGFLFWCFSFFDKPVLSMSEQTCSYHD